MARDDQPAGPAKVAEVVEQASIVRDDDRGAAERAQPASQPDDGLLVEIEMRVANASGRSHYWGMLLNRVEKSLMNNPLRAASQRWFEVPRLRAMAPHRPPARALEIGCGRGIGTELLVNQLGALRVDAFDLDPEMVALAKKRLARYGDRVRVWQGDVEHIDAADGTYDAVFDFAIIHHVPDWRNALREVARVLASEGRFYGEEVLRDFIDNPFWRRLLDHPREDRFDAGELAAGLEAVGLRVAARRDFFGQIAWFVAEKSALRA